MATIRDTLAIGLMFQQCGDLSRAEQVYGEILEADPTVAQAWNLLGAIHQVRGNLDEAVANYHEALRLEPGLAEARNNLGLLIYNQGKTNEATGHFREAIRLKPQYPDALTNLGNALNADGEPEQAVACYRRAIELDRAHGDAHHNLGNTLRELGQLDEALLCYERAIWIKPDEPQYHLGRAILWLTQGDFERGWTEYEWRWKCPEHVLPNYSQPVWDGGPLNGRIILLHADHGMGDTLQFVRYAPIVERMGGRVVVACQRPLARILANCVGIDQLVLDGDPLPEFDVYAPLMSLPRILRTSLATVPATVPYLKADPALVAEWGRELNSFEGFKVGIAWQGNPQYRHDRWRSFPLSELEPLARIDGVRLFSLQREPGSEQLQACGERIQVTDLTGGLRDFMDNAALISNLDLVITPDTSLAHLAGGLGVPVWLALSFSSDPRWMTEREDSDWYPKHRLFRQNVRGRWTDVFERMATELARKLGTPR